MKKEEMEPKIAPDLLRKLRERTGYSEKQVAKKINISPEELSDIESGKLKVSLTIIKKLSESYKFPLVTFFEEKPPEYPHQFKDYRINREKKLSPEVYKAERRAYYLVSELRDISEDRSKIPEFSNNLSAVELSKMLIEKIQLTRLVKKKSEEILSHYKKELENKLGIVIIEYPLKAEDVRAFCISSEIAIVVLNESDKPEIKLFSLFHELCHLLKKTSAICSIQVEQEQSNEIEYYCNLFAAEILVPAAELKIQVAEKGVTENAITEYTILFGVSRQVIMLRLLNNGHIHSERYQSFRSRIDEKAIKASGFRRRNWDKVNLNRVGNLALKEVGKAYRSGRISSSEAMDILNMKSKYVEKYVETGG